MRILLGFPPRLKTSSLRSHRENHYKHLTKQSPLKCLSFACWRFQPYYMVFIRRCSLLSCHGVQTFQYSVHFEHGLLGHIIYMAVSWSQKSICYWPWLTNLQRYGIRGVPQGSVLGPLLFILYINEICKVSKNSDIYLFADTNLFWCGRNLKQPLDAVEKELKLNLMSWF